MSGVGPSVARVRRSSGVWAIGGNLAARLGAMGALAVTTVLVAHVEGPTGVGQLALLRVLPGLVGVVLSGGLPAAAPYFLARPRPGLHPTLAALVLGAGALGTVAWWLATPWLGPTFFEAMPATLVAVAGVTVASQLFATGVKAVCQGRSDIAGSNLVILLEDGVLPVAYGLVVLAGGSGPAAAVAALVASDLVAGAGGLRRLRREGFTLAGRPDRALAREVIGFGTRAQAGALVGLLNLRLDFALLAVLAGTDVVGVYAVASKLAEVLRLPGLAITYVLYPRLAAADPASARRTARRLGMRAQVLVALAAVPVLVATPLVVALAFPPEFAGAVTPARVLVVGLALSGGSSVAAAYLLAIGRPGRNSIALGAGTVLTLALDVLLVPQHGVLGAAIASCVAYVGAAAAQVVAARSAGPAALQPSGQGAIVAGSSDPGAIGAEIGESPTTGESPTRSRIEGSRGERALTSDVARLARSGGEAP